MGKIETSDKNYDEAIKHFSYLLNTLEDELGRYELASLALKQKDYDKALPMLNSLYVLGNKHATLELLNFAVNQKKFAEALKYLDKLSDFLAPTLINNYQFFIKYNLQMLNSDDYENANNFSKQVMKFNCDDAKLNIILSNKYNTKTKNTAKFISEDISKMYDFAKEQFKTLEPVYVGLVDKYVIDLGYVIGTYKEALTTKIEVVTISNTYNVIDINPTNEVYNKDLSYHYDDTIEKVRRKENN